VAVAAAAAAVQIKRITSILRTTEVLEVLVEVVLETAVQEDKQ
jgi:hypothetical protein